MTKLSLKFPASWESLLDTMGLKAEDGWMPQWYKGTLGDCPGSEMSLSLLEFLKFLTCLLR